MSRLLDQELQNLKQRAAGMAHSVQQSLVASVAAILEADEAAARLVCDSDQAINDQRFSLEADVVMVIATQQPVAGDVRLLVSILEIAIELERMGDYAKDIARIAIRQASFGVPQPPAGIARMADLSVSMLERTVQAFVNDDPQLAHAVAKDDDEVDELCRSLHRGLLAQAHAEGSQLDEAVRLLQAVHNIERFADRATNICERVVYVATGEQVEFDDRTTS